MFNLVSGVSSRLFALIRLGVVGWCDGAVLGKLPVPGRPTIWIQ